MKRKKEKEKIIRKKSSKQDKKIHPPLSERQQSSQIQMQTSISEVTPLHCISVSRPLVSVGPHNSGPCRGKSLHS